MSCKVAQAVIVVLVLSGSTSGQDGPRRVSTTSHDFGVVAGAGTQSMPLRSRTSMLTTCMLPVFGQAAPARRRKSGRRP